ncbi:unnamed protein product, partial [Ascophyllum nodosum]
TYLLLLAQSTSMIGSVARRAAGTLARPNFRPVAFRNFSTAEAPAVMKLNFGLPHQTIYKEKVVDQVIIPGSEGEYGVTAGHSPIVAELKPGVVQVMHEPGQEPEKFFVSAGFALTHPTSVTDITAIEAVRVEELDEAAVREAYDSSKREMEAAPNGSREEAEAQVAFETSKAMGSAIGVTLA